MNNLCFNRFTLRTDDAKTLRKILRWLALNYRLYEYLPSDAEVRGRFISCKPFPAEAFRRQIRVAKEAGLPVVLHIREAHDDAFAILQEEGFPKAGTLLHCFNLDWAELERWVEAGCHVAFGGPVTFKHADEVRDAAARVPEELLLTETDAPYMTPEPLRGATCGPEHVVFTAEKLCEVRGLAFGEERETFLRRLLANAYALLDREPTPWQRERAEELGIKELSPAERARAAVAQWRAGKA